MVLVGLGSKGIEYLLRDVITCFNGAQRSGCNCGKKCELEFGSVEISSEMCHIRKQPQELDFGET